MAETLPQSWLVATRAGPMFVAPNDVVIGQALRRYGQWAWFEVELLRSLATGATFVDVGANIGAHTIALARSAARVVAYEPQPSLAKLLRASVAAGNLSNVEVRECAVGDSTGSILLDPIDLEGSTNVNWGAVRISGQGSHSVPLVRLDDEFKDSKVDVLKIDVETMEPLVLLGARQLLDRDRPAVYLELLDPMSAWAVWEALRDLNYRLFLHRCPHFDPNNFNRVSLNEYGDGFDVMLLCLPADRAAPAIELTRIESMEHLLRMTLGAESRDAVVRRLQALSGLVHDGYRAREYKQQIDGLLASSSWRMTEPLRRAIRLIRR